MGFTRLSLETGVAEFFLPARKLYRPDPNSAFMTRPL